MIRSFGLVEQGASDRQHLLLAARELRAAVLPALCKARETGRRRPSGVQPSPPVSADHPQVLVDGERREQPPPLRHVADTQPGDPVRRPAEDLVPAEADRTSCGSVRDGIMPMIAAQSVVLPMPLRPTTATDSAPISKSTLCRMCAEP